MTFKTGVLAAVMASALVFGAAYAKVAESNKGLIKKRPVAENKKAADRKRDEQLIEAEQQISEFSLSGYGDKGKKSWDISGQSADIMKDTVKLDKVVGNLYGKEEDVKLTADKGDFNKTSGKVNLRENVVITSSSGTKMVTDSLDWDRKGQVVTTDEIVNIEKDGMTVVARGARGEPNLKKIALEKDIKLDIKPAEGAKDGSAQEMVEVDCDGPLEIDYQKNVATFNNNVKVTRAGSTIYSDKMDVFFLTGNKKEAPEGADVSNLTGGKIDRIVARGNVRVVQGENVSYSDEAIYSAIDRKIILTGKPKLVIYSAEGIK